MHFHHTFPKLCIVGNIFFVKAAVLFPLGFSKQRDAIVSLFCVQFLVLSISLALSIICLCQAIVSCILLFERCMFVVYCHISKKITCIICFQYLQLLLIIVKPFTTPVVYWLKFLKRHFRYTYSHSVKIWQTSFNTQKFWKLQGLFVKIKSIYKEKISSKFLLTWGSKKVCLNIVINIGWIRLSPPE